MLDNLGRGTNGLWVVGLGAESKRLTAGVERPTGWTTDGAAVFAQTEGSREILRVWLDGRREVYVSAPTMPGWCRPVGPSAPGRFLCTAPITISDAWLLELENP